MSGQVRVVAVVVAYNRRELLREALQAIQAQAHPVEALVVVDNASNDGTSAMVREEFPSVDLVTLRTNTGGAGGFAVGLAHAVSRYEPDWAWLMDDDTVPTSSALLELVAGVTRYGAGVNVAGSSAVWTDGSPHPMNTPRPNPFASRSRREKASAVEVVDVRSTSFVSMLVRTEAVRRRGLPIADYFIWNDDFEYSTRLIRRAVGISVPASVVVHKTARLVGTDDDPGARFYYEVRNKVWMFSRSRGLAPAEKAVYGASSVARWFRTAARSTSRGVLLSALRRGIVDGIRTSPKSNRRLLESLGETTGADIVRAWSRQP